MFSKVALITCLFGIANAGVLLNSGLGSGSGYGHEGYGSDNYGGGYSGGHGGAVSHISITRAISPSVPYNTGYSGHGYTGAQGYSHGYSSNAGLGSNGYDLGYGAHGYNNGHGLNHAISSVSQYSVHSSPVTSHYGSYAPSAYDSYSSGSYGGYAGKGW